MTAIWRPPRRGSTLTLEISSILRDELPRAKFTVSEAPWVGSFVRAQVTFDVNARRPLLVYLTQDGERAWKAASFVSGGVCFENGTSPDILRKLIVRLSRMGVV